MPVREFDCLRLGTAMAREGVRSQGPGVSNQPGPADCAGPLKIPGELPPRKGDAPGAIHPGGTEGAEGNVAEIGAIEGVAGNLGDKQDDPAAVAA
jgi:hypothetical protein